MIKIDVFQSINNNGKIYNAANRVGFQIMPVDTAMTKGIKILIAIILFLFVILIAVTTNNLIKVGTMVSAINADSESGHTSQSKEQASPANFIREQKSTNNDTENRLPGHYETIEETITRLKRDVIVTGTILGTQGEESAIFQIEGMADRSFKINTQLMDGFIIKEITSSYVVLKNQAGNETFSLYVQSGGESLDDTGVEPEFNSTPAVPDGYDAQQFSDDIQNTIDSSEYPENAEQAINAQNETGYLENTDLEQNPNTTPMTPDEYDSQQLLNEIENSNYASDEPDGDSGIQPEETD